MRKLVDMYVGQLLVLELVMKMHGGLEKRCRSSCSGSPLKASRTRQARKEM